MTLALVTSAPLAANFERVGEHDGRWDCVRDLRTSLVWEVKTADSGLRDARHTYAWSPRNVRGSVARCGIASCDAQSYASEVNRAGLCGANDWRLPTREELRSLVDYSRALAPTIDIEMFPNTVAQFHWATDTDASDSRNAWGIGFAFGFDYAYPKENAAQVRLVRGNARTPDACDATTRFELRDDGTVRDRTTGLIWQRCSVGLTWNDGHCTGHVARLTRNDLEKIATPPWRIPRIDELSGLVNLNCTNPSINIPAFPDTLASDYWTATPLAHNPALHWFVNFMYGDSYANDADALGFARLVRD